MAQTARRSLLGTGLGLSLTVAAIASHEPLIQYTGTGTDHLGAACAFGDVDGDGVPDIIVGTDGGNYVDVYDGASPNTKLFRVTGAAGDAFGSALAAGDLNGDGKDDVVVGAYAWDGPAGADQGYVQAYTYNGTSGSLLFRLEGSKLTDTFGAVARGSRSRRRREGRASRRRAVRRQARYQQQHWLREAVRRRHAAPAVPLGRARGVRRDGAQRRLRRRERMTGRRTSSSAPAAGTAPTMAATSGS